MQDCVKFQTLSTDLGKQIGVATLNKASSLNALSLEMIDLLLPQLTQWQADQNIVAVLLDGDGDKAFCAGGDVVAMYKAMQQEPKTIPASIKAFFSREYELDYLIHQYAKPLIVWGNGIVMGGGLGLMSGGSHRIVTESSRIAMPEITIGLYPDVGGSWFLNKMPQGCGLFLGLTGASMNAADALYVNLADHFVAHEHKGDFLSALTQVNWQQDADANRLAVTELCQVWQNTSKDMLPDGNVEAHQDLISEICNADNIQTVVANILQLDVVEDKWLKRAQGSLAKGSPITAHLVFEQLQRASDKSLADCFRMELVMSCRCAESGEFQEGVRALLIDKDNTPNWRFSQVEDVPSEYIEQYFTAPWPADADPLAQLGN